MAPDAKWWADLFERIGWPKDTPVEVWDGSAFVPVDWSQKCDSDD